MEKALLMDDNHNRSDLLIASKSVGSFIKIDSLSINLADVTGDKISHETGKCDHFSIRGFVSEVRKKDWRLCWPFAADGDLNKLQKVASLLPPLDPPNSRLQSCLKCMTETGLKSIEKDHMTEINSSDVGATPNNTGAVMPPVSDAPVLLSDCQQDPKSKIVGGESVEVHTSTIGNSNEQYPSSCTVGAKERQNKVVAASVTANVDKEVPKIWDKKLLADALEDDSIETPRPNSVETEANPERMQERHGDETEAPELEGNGSIEVCEPGCEIHEDTIIELDLINKKFLNKNSTQTSEADGRISAEGNKKEPMNASGTCKIAEIVEMAHKVAKAQTSIDRPMIMDEYDYASENLDKSSYLNRKKTRRVRVRKLSELGDAKTDCIRKENSPSYTIGNTSGAVSQGQVSVPGNARAGLGENKKRKSPDKEQGDKEESRPKSLNRTVKKASKLGEEITKAIAGSQLEEDAVAKLSSQADVNRNGSRKGIERVPTTGKKKTLKSSDCGASSSLVPPEDNVPVEVPDNVGNSGKCNATRRSHSLMFDVSTGGGKDQVPFFAPKTGRKSDFCKRKDKMPEVDNEQDSIFPWSIFPNGSNTRKNVEIVPTRHPFHPTEDASCEEGLELSLSSYFPTQKSERKSIPQSEDGSPSLRVWKDGTCKQDRFMRETVEPNYAANLNNVSKSMSNAFSGKGVHGELGSKFSTYGQPILTKKQNYSSQIEQTSSSLQKMDISRARDKDKVIEVQKHSLVPVSRKQSNRIPEKMSQQGAADEMPPMDIIELMAKNQLERGGHGAEIIRLCSETAANKARNAQMINHSPGVGEIILEENTRARKTQERNVKNGITTMKKVGPAEQKSVDNTYVSGKDSGSCLDQPPLPTGFTSSHPQKKSTRDSLSGAGSDCHCAENCKWDEDLLGTGLPHSSSRALAPCNANQSVPQSKQDAPRHWSSVPVPAPSTYRNPPNFSAQPSNACMLSPPPASLFKGNVHGGYDQNPLYRNATTGRKLNEGVASESFVRNNAEYSFIGRHHGTEPRGNDLHQGAMQLLSLAHLHATLKIPFSFDLNSKESSGVDIGVYKATDTVKYPSPNFSGKNHLSGKSLDLFPTPHTGGASTPLFQHSNGFKRAPNSIAEVSLGSQKKQKMQRSSAPAHDRGPGSQTSAGGGLGKTCGTIPVPSMQKRFHAVADHMMIAQQAHTMQYRMLQILESRNANGAVMPPKIRSDTLFCSINRNPAEFTIPEVGNQYMISGEDLKFRKQLASGKRPGPHGVLKVDQNKRQRNKKQTTGKERA